MSDAAEVVDMNLNKSGIQPVEYKVLIKLDPIEETDPLRKRASDIGLELLSEYTDREQMSQVKGVLVAVGGNAFDDWLPPKPNPGDRVMIRKLEGVSSEGKDGEEYRICNDKDIMAIIE
ncbi:MAG: hypothetical protein GWN86_10695 [Desulfobacterales bacterium]|nr:hypothetical protein [Desulfobacterales bacterium]